ncbi:MAG: OmpA family protein [Chitinophagaceae bacterium]
MKSIIPNYDALRLTCLLVCITLLQTAHSQMSDSCIALKIGTVAFKANNVKINTSLARSIDSIILTIRKSPDCAIVVTGTSETGCADGRRGQRSWDRVFSVVKYLIKKGVSENRIVFQFGHVPKEEYVELRLGSQEKWDIPPPHPNLRQHKTDSSKIDAALR